MKGLRGSFAALWSLALGIGQVAFWPALPWDADTAAALALGVISVALLAVIGGWLSRFAAAPRFALCYLLLPFVLGSCWALQANHQSLAERLPLALHGKDHKVTLEIEGLPEASTAVANFGSPGVVPGFFDSRFRARVRDSERREFVGKRLLLRWYRVDPDTMAKMIPGSRWSMTLRLKRPRGSINPHTFDYEAWLLEQGIYATGYVRERGAAPEYLGVERGVGSLVSGLREHLRRQITAPDAGDHALKQEELIRALLLGDTGGVDSATQDLLRRTGTAHLLAISGLHVGMVAGFFLLLGGLVSRVVGIFRPHNPLLVAGAAGLAAAMAYTLVSGAPLSAQRALIMTTIAIVALVFRRRFGAGLAFVTALACVLLLQPLAPLNAGFWLSFVAVGALLLRFRGRSSGEDGETAGQERPRIQVFRPLNYLRTALQSQWAILVGLALPSILIFAGVSLSGLLLNLIAIPWVGFTILPLIFLAALTPAPLQLGLWRLADIQLGWLLDFLAVADSALPGWQSLPLPSHLILLLAPLSCGVLLLPRGLPGRALGWALLPVLLVGLLPWTRPSEPYLALTVLDVGQGLAVVAATERKTLVFDTGASSGSGWSAGRSIVAPFLLADGRQRLDALVVSHGDRDHAGGVPGVMSQLRVDTLIAPGTLASRWPGAATSSPCVAGGRELWGELHIEWLWPRTSGLSGDENDHSCVALLTWRGVRILLAGDITSNVEAQLPARYPAFAPVDLLIAPHHGSRTSSSPALLDWARPARVVFSAGFRHHFGHPHPEVVARYRRLPAQQFNTADSGAVRFHWDGSGQLNIERARARGRFWYADHSNKKVNNQALSHSGEL
ncbi:DNA internalization-related competence protein ComEC/Rec2 [Microbulbifer sp. SH-1]|uniref:DNA internalization-related competence protein ComEC/Rec2 n=1 Tax=Microbulbifer sp. SH-1 TaxID=2681547 RepID=UPI0014084953|nr:DNA internalization-related competence protein ComEC/Rec2 [Microbulbifer sp. SH-1]QIL89265.1 DNA internalization-related competence protein ComEC/Rec2 [Microbulbifer sp. SH-1]